jgi:hypothetical protein
MFGLSNELLMGLVVGAFLGYYLGNKEFRVKINAMIFKKKPEVKPPETKKAE